jgi:hypothetical protein
VSRTTLTEPTTCNKVAYANKPAQTEIWAGLVVGMRQRNRLLSYFEPLVQPGAPAPRGASFSMVLSVSTLT